MLHALILAMALTPQQTASVDDVVEQSMKRYELPVASVAIVEHGQIAYVQGYNTQARDRFSIGSVTKEIIATEILHLRDRKKLRMDDSIERYFPSAPHVTIRRLLDQTSGIVDYNTPAILIRLAPAATTGRLQPSLIASTVLSQRLAFPPGSRFQYSNSNYLLLGLIIERISGKPLEAVLKRDIFDPLKMQHTSLANADFCHRDVVCGWTKLPWGIGHVKPWDAAVSFAAGGIISTAEDLARFDTSLLRSPEYASWRRIEYSRVPNGSYAIGSYEYLSDGKRVVWHDGTVPGFKALNSIVLDDGDAVVVLTAGDYAHASIVAMQLEHVLFGIPGGEGERFDPNLPAASYAIALLCLVCLTITALSTRTISATASVLGLLSYLSAIYLWYAGVAFCVAAIIVLLYAKRKKARIRSSNPFGA